MATGYIPLPFSAWTTPDGSTNNVGPGISRLKGSQTNAVHILTYVFDGAGSAVEQLYTNFKLPGDYASGGSLVIQGTINSTTGNVAFMQAAVGAITPADADTPLEHALSTAATVSITANTTEARRLLEGTITLNMDSAAAGDEIIIRLLRDPANGSDTHTSDFEFHQAEFQYTTT